MTRHVRRLYFTSPSKPGLDDQPEIEDDPCLPSRAAFDLLPALARAEYRRGCDVVRR